MSHEASAPSTPAPPRLVGIFISPTATFADIVRKPSFIVPLVVLIASGLLLTAVLLNRVGIERIVETELAKNPRIAEMPSEQRERVMEQSMKVGKVMAWVGPLLAPPIMMAIVAGILLMMTNFVFGGQTNFKTMFSVTVWGWMPGLVGALLGIVIVFLRDPADIDIQNLIASNPGILVEPSEHPALARLLSSLDLFSFWQIFLLGTGVSAAGRFSLGKGLMAVIIPWAVYVLAVTGWRAAFS